MNWFVPVIDLINDAISDKEISKADLADGLEEIEEHASSWAEQMRRELREEE